MAADVQPPAEEDPRVRRAALGRRAIRFATAVEDRLATRVDRTPAGAVRLTPDLPLWFAGSTAEVERPAAVAELLPDVDRRFTEAGLAHRRIATWVPEVAWVLAGVLPERGWDAERYVLMVHDRRTRPPVSPVGVGPVDLDTWLPYARAMTADEAWGRDPAVQADFVARDRRTAQRIDVRWILERGGRQAGCTVYRHGGVAQIEGVHVLSSARGQGLGHAVMAAALAACEDASLVLLVADADDWPQTWYARLGFEPAASGWSWLRQPAV